MPGRTNTMAGIFELYTDLHAQLRFRLLAPDGTVLATSQAYPDKFTAAAAITDVRECAGTGLIQDHSAATPKVVGLQGQYRRNTPRTWNAHEEASTHSSTPPSQMDSRLQVLVLDKHDIGQFLAGLAALAAIGLSHADPEMSCGITVRQPKKPVALAGSELGAKSLDELHNIIGEGPNLTAMAEQRTVLAATLANERQWPRFVGSALRHGIRSILCIPLSAEGETRAALSLYARRTNAFSPEDIDIAEAFASQASMALGLVLHLAHLKDTKKDQSAALAHRAIIHATQVR
jgi:GAF domain-containing protein